MAEARQAPLHVLADAVGLARTWQDVHDRTRIVPDETLEALLDAMGLECGSGARLECSLRRMREEASHLDGRTIVVEAGEPIVLRHDGPLHYRLEYESGTGGRDGEARPRKDGSVQLPPVDTPGYHPLQLGRSRLLLAVAPRRCAAAPEGGTQ